MENKDESALEIEELTMQIADMLGVALYFAGVKKQNIPQAIEEYVNAIDEVYKDDEDGEMGVDEIINVIQYLQKNKKDLFE